MIRFDVSALTKAPLGTSLTLDIDTGPQHLSDGPPEVAEVLDVNYLRGTMRLTRIERGLLLQGVLESQLELECVRCLEPFALTITLELEETFRLSGAGQVKDGIYAVSDEGWLDLAPLLREQGWIAIPMKPLCSPDCKGLCPQCGANLNLEPCTCERTRVDPRLASLRDLL
ncbi:MAG: DUF177 domain-containing protein [Chloroflexi bacterium]|nr:MAG: DUF177 domain-containing protein [Chloroflexota bacterium]